MGKLLELEEKLRKAKAELEKNIMQGYGSNVDQSAGMAMDGASTMLGKKDKDDEEKDDEEKDKKKDKKMIEKEMDEHNEDKHGEPKDENSAMKKSDEELVKYSPNGQWSIQTSDSEPKE